MTIKIGLCDSQKRGTTCIAEGAIAEAYYEIEAEVIDSFAIHRTTQGDLEHVYLADCYTLTHIPTGAAIDHYLPSEEAARWLAKEIRYFTDWSRFHPESCNYEQVKRRVRPLVREACERFD